MNNLYLPEIFDIVLKAMSVMALVLYTGFAVVLIRQVGVMAESIEDPFNGLFKIGAWVHLVMAALLVLMAVVIL